MHIPACRELPRKCSEAEFSHPEKVLDNGPAECIGLNLDPPFQRVEEACGIIAIPHFERFRTFPGRFAGITPQILASGNFRLLPGDVTAPRAALAMARIAAYLSHADQAREFAEVGLASLGPRATIAVGVARDLAAIAGR
jgi:hypothetical protein